MRTSRRRMGVAALALAALTLAAACGDDDDDDGGAGDDGCTGRDRRAGRDRGAGRRPRRRPAPRPGGTGGGGEGDYVIGVSNTLAGNGWREEMICAVKAQALASGAGQRGHRDLQERRPDRADPGPPEPDLAGRQRDHRQPVGPRAAQPGHRGGDRPGHRRRRRRPGRHRRGRLRRQQRPGRLRPPRRRSGSPTSIGGEGSVLYMRGIDGVPADTDRDTGFQEVMAEYPDIEIKEVFTGWDFTKGGDIAVQELTAADYDGIWTSGIDYTVVNAFETVGKDPVPVVGADNNGFVKQLLDGTPGAAVTNPAVIGGVGTAIALQAPQRRGARADDAADAAGVGPREQPGRPRGQLLPGPGRHVQLGRHGRGLHRRTSRSSSSTARAPGSDLRSRCGGARCRPRPARRRSDGTR